MLKYNIRTGVRKIKTKTAIAVSAMAIGVGGIIGSVAIFGAAHAANTTIYNNIPSPQPGNVPSVSFEATGTSEFGGQVSFAGTNRLSPTVTVLMSSWGCETGHWTSENCATTPGATFSEPITLNVYSVGSGNSVGPLVTSVTQSFNIPYRPSADPVNCTGGDAGKWFDGTKCNNGFATPISFNLSGVTLPDNAIVSVAYNTSDYGASPYGHGNTCNSTAAGCGYDSLNVGTANALTAGAQPVADSAYQLTQFDSCTNATVNPFGIDSPCWTGFQPAFKVEASNSTVTVTIDKFVNGVQATTANTNSASFPMVSSWSATNIGTGSGSYTLGPVGFNNSTAYFATTSDMTVGASYSTNEVLGTNVSASCSVNGGGYALVGYTTGSTLAAAETSTLTPTSPAFTNLQNDQFVIVWNKSCAKLTTADQCKDNGWRNYGSTFKNQGDCVSFVATNGKNQPSGPAKH